MTESGFQENAPLRRVSDDGDYELAGESCWIAVNGVSIHVFTKNGYVNVHAYRTGQETEPPIQGFCQLSD